MKFGPTAHPAVASDAVNATATGRAGKPLISKCEFAAVTVRVPKIACDSITLQAVACGAAKGMHA